MEKILRITQFVGTRNKLNQLRRDIDEIQENPEVGNFRKLRICLVEAEKILIIGFIPEAGGETILWGSNSMLLPESKNIHTIRSAWIWAITHMTGVAVSAKVNVIAIITVLRTRSLGLLDDCSKANTRG